MSKRPASALGWREGAWPKRVLLALSVVSLTAGAFAWRSKIMHKAVRAANSPRSLAGFRAQRRVSRACSLKKSRQIALGVRILVRGGEVHPVDGSLNDDAALVDESVFDRRGTTGSTLIRRTPDDASPCGACLVFLRASGQGTCGTGCCHPLSSHSCSSRRADLRRLALRGHRVEVPLRLKWHFDTSCRCGLQCSVLATQS